MACSNSGKDQSAGSAPRTSFKLKLKNPDFARDCAAAMDVQPSTNASSSHSSEIGSSLLSKPSSNSDADSDTSDTSTCAGDAAPPGPANNAAPSDETSRSYLSARRKGKSPAPIETVIAVNVHPGLNTDGDAPSSAENLSSDRRFSNASPDYASSNASPESKPEPEPQRSPTPAPCVVFRPYHSSKQIKAKDGACIPTTLSGASKGGFEWHVSPGRHSTGWDTMKEHMSAVEIPQNEPYVVAHLATFGSSQAPAAHIPSASQTSDTSAISNATTGPPTTLTTALSTTAFVSTATTISSTTHLQGTTPKAPDASKVGKEDILPAPWHCGNRDCKTGQTWLDRGRTGRKCISDFFGKNKTSTRTIDDDVWHWICRKDYQRTEYRITKDSKRFQLWQLFLVRTQFDRLELWRPDATFTIKLVNAMSDRLSEFHKVVDRNDGDRDAAIAELDSNLVLKKDKKTQKPIWPSEVACPMDVAEYFNNNHKQEGASIAVCRGVVNWMTSIINTRSLVASLPIEFLIDDLKKGETVNDPSANYQQWTARVDAVVAAAMAAGNFPEPDITYCPTPKFPSRARRAAARLSPVPEPILKREVSEDATAANTAIDDMRAISASPVTPTTEFSAKEDNPMSEINADNIDVQAVKGLLYLTGKCIDLPTSMIERALAAASSQAALTGISTDRIDYQHSAHVHIAAAKNIATGLQPGISPAAPKRKRIASSDSKGSFSFKRQRNE